MTSDILSHIIMILNAEVNDMTNKKNISLNDEEIKQLGIALSLADISSSAPKERNPRIPMQKDELFDSALKNGIDKYNALKTKGEI